MQTETDTDTVVQITQLQNEVKLLKNENKHFQPGVKPIHLHSQTIQLYYPPMMTQRQR